MQAIILREAGYEEALLGLSLSYNQPMEAMRDVAFRLRDKDDGHNKFLESIAVWLDITAPRYWWQQMDTYRVGMSKQSGSTMHTLARELKQARLMNSSVLWDWKREHFTEETSILRVKNFIDDAASENYSISYIKANLLEGFLQRRTVFTNYMTLRRIIKQRSKHKLFEWVIFINALQELEHKELLPCLC